MILVCNGTALQPNLTLKKRSWSTNSTNIEVFNYMLGLSDVKTKEKAKQKLRRLGSKNGQKRKLEHLRKTLGSMRS